MKKWNARLDHAAVATREPEKLKKVLELIGLGFTGTEPVPSQGVLTHFLKGEPNHIPQVELLEPTDNQGVIAKYLDKKGVGIHHLSFMVDHLDALCGELKQNGVRLTYDAPREGAHHTRVNFIHPESTGGVLIEISEKKSG